MAQTETVMTLKEFMARTQSALTRGDVNEAVKLATLIAQSFPNNEQALFFAGTVSFQVNEYKDAIAYLLNALSIKPNHNQAKEFLLYSLYMEKKFDVSELLVKAFTQILRYPEDLNSDLIVRVWVMIVKQHPSLSRIISDTKNMDHKIFQSYLQNLTAEQIALITSDFFSLGISLYIVPDVEIENFLMQLRRFLLSAINSYTVLEENLVLALAQYSYNSEYLLPVSDDENALLEKLITTPVKNLTSFQITMIAAYRPLHRFAEICKVLRQVFSPLARKKSLRSLVKQQISEPLVEMKLAENFPSLSEIDNDISDKVRQMYEENPYPKWTLPKAIHNDDLAIKEGIYSSSVKNILIAGCATGAYPINVARAHPRVKVTGIDLSLASLCYGKRKALELKVKNLEFLQGDILKISDLGRTFEIIETVGVLHHMQNPQKGLDALMDVLSRAGYIKIGLYSSLARRHISACRQDFVDRGFLPTPEGMNKARHYVLSLPENHPYKSFLQYNDFYNLSMMRDMLFHVQEHCYTIPQFRELLDKAGLVFIGFSDIGTGEAFANYKERFPEDQVMNNLENWHIFEQENPDTFIGMYKFWCRKK